MVDETISIVNLNSFSGISILDTSNYATFGNQSQYNYLKVNITDPNGNVTAYGNNIVDNTIPTPADFGTAQPSYNFAYTQAGVYTVKYIHSSSIHKYFISRYMGARIRVLVEWKLLSDY